MQRSKWILIGVSCAMGISFLIVIAYARNETGEDRDYYYNIGATASILDCGGGFYNIQSSHYWWVKNKLNRTLHVLWRCQLYLFEWDKANNRWIGVKDKRDGGYKDIDPGATAEWTRNLSFTYQLQEGRKYRVTAYTWIDEHGGKLDEVSWP